MNAEKNTFLTWYPPEYVALHEKNRKGVAGTAYAKYMAEDMVVPLDMVEALKRAPLPEGSLYAPTKKDLNELFKDSYNLPVAGYGLLGNPKDGRVICSFSRHFFPGATAKMMKWWFLWHMGHQDRYSLWSPFAHMDNTVPYPKRLEDTSKTYEERLYDPENPNRVMELVGDHVLDTYLHFMDPMKLGITEETWKAGGYASSASGWSDTKEAPGIPGGIMYHLGREVDSGLELISHYWIGLHRGMGELTGKEDLVNEALAKAQPVPDEVLLHAAFDMSMHDMIEFTRLSQILPALYAEFKGDPVF